MDGRSVLRCLGREQMTASWGPGGKGEVYVVCPRGGVWCLSVFAAHSCLRMGILQERERDFMRDVRGLVPKLAASGWGGCCVRIEPVTAALQFLEL